MPVEDQALLGSMEDPSGKNWAGQSNQFGLPLGWENMEDPTGRSWGGSGVTPRTLNFGPSYGESADPLVGKPMDPPVFTGSSDGGGAGAPPAGALDYSGGAPTGMPSNWHDFTGHGTSTGGGFWSFKDYYAGLGKDIPDQFQSGAALPSTNNYHLLPPEYQMPNFIMRNGQIINLNDPNLHGPAALGKGWASGATMGVPSAWPITQGNNMASWGWPGALSGWSSPVPAWQG